MKKLEKRTILGCELGVSEASETAVATLSFVISASTLIVASREVVGSVVDMVDQNPSKLTGCER